MTIGPAETMNRWHACGGPCGAFYCHDAGIVSKSAEGLAKMMTVIVIVFDAAGLTVS